MGDQDESQPVALNLPATPVISAGGAFTCLLSTAGRIVCWGRVAAAAADSFWRPVQIGDAAGEPFAAVAVGDNACALTTSGRAYCWGGVNNHGQLGTGTRTPAATPTAVAGGLRFVAIAVGAGLTCALTARGQTYCWGRGEGGIFGGERDTPRDRYVPTLIAATDGLQAIEAGSVVCGLARSGVPLCWGEATGSFDPGAWIEPGVCQSRYFIRFEERGCSSPTPVEGSPVLRTITTGGETACGVAADGQAWCWGGGWLGTLGNGTAGSRTHAVKPVRVSRFGDFTSVSAGATHVCGLRATGDIVCWGNNFRGYLGRGTREPGASEPAPISSSRRFVALASGWAHVCAIDVDAAVWCWGQGETGALGRSPQVGDAFAPVEVEGLRAH
ncbi:MAG: hypothetical protein MUF00_20925 [Gemmatimonadaceae bacterium]|nr:hypothetical protein [Gemmatimonadaceae bacterium]